MLALIAIVGLTGTILFGLISWFVDSMFEAREEPMIGLLLRTVSACFFAVMVAAILVAR
jgi:F0F1-type ATP synthase assembly protein I